MLQVKTYMLYLLIINLLVKYVVLLGIWQFPNVAD